MKSDSEFTFPFQCYFEEFESKIRLIELKLQISNLSNFRSLNIYIIEKQVLEIENEIEKVVENIDVSTIDNDLLIDFIQKQQVSSAIAISLLRKKMSSE